MDFVEEAFGEIDQQEREETLRNEKVRSLLTQRSARISEKNYGDVTIRFRTSITKRLRARLSKISPNIKQEEMNQFLYETLALMCVDEPFTSWKTWAVYDEELDEGGVGAFEILTDILVEVKSQTESIRGFR